jgi:hypothetical protein
MGGAENRPWLLLVINQGPGYQEQEGKAAELVTLFQKTKIIKTARSTRGPPDNSNELKTTGAYFNIWRLAIEPQLTRRPTLHALGRPEPHSCNKAPA